ncbi:hypothetical protein Tco_1078653 [Tanacetum coccineum]|uniref:Uncharacterized protein n=1 Tax=Tanacetum coccineum TaxID=301880 RepID=A0ABQ5HPL2_9ASTR
MDMNSEAIMLPDVEDLYAEEEEIVHRDLNFFSKALSFLVCLPQPKRHRRTNINRDHYGAHDRLLLTFLDETICEDPLLLILKSYTPVTKKSMGSRNARKSSLYRLGVGWRFTTQKNLLWTRVIKAIHGEDEKNGSRFKVGYKSIWRSILQEVETLKIKEAVVEQDQFDGFCTTFRGRLLFLVVTPDQIGWYWTLDGWASRISSSHLFLIALLQAIFADLPLVGGGFHGSAYVR